MYPLTVITENESLYFLPVDDRLYFNDAGWVYARSRAS
jgi:hypothetical protein